MDSVLPTQSSQKFGCPQALRRTFDVDGDGKGKLDHGEILEGLKTLSKLHHNSKHNIAETPFLALVKAAVDECKVKPKGSGVRDWCCLKECFAKVADFGTAVKATCVDTCVNAD